MENHDSPIQAGLLMAQTLSGMKAWVTPLGKEPWQNKKKKEPWPDEVLTDDK